MIESTTQVAYHTLEAQLVDRKYGLVQSLQTRFPHPGEPPIYTAEARLSYQTNDFGMSQIKVGGSGAALDENHARISALCESIERYCLNADVSDIIVDNYNNISQHFAALSPEECPLFHPDQYPGVGFDPFTSETKIAWSWATSLPQGNLILVPAELLYLRHPTSSEEGHLMSTISTGAACGSSGTDAVVRGIYEIAERDAMMIMWLNRYPCPRLVVDPQSNLGQFIKRYLRSTNLSYQLFWITNDLQIPACMAVLLEGKAGVQRIFVGLAANLSPEKAAMNALLEALEVRLGVFNLREVEQTIEVPEAINTVHKHAIYYIQQDRTHLLDFLLNTSNTIELASIPDKSTGDPQLDLDTCLDHCLQVGQDVFVADLTKEDIRPTGLRVVRVIMPGMQRLTTNHNKPYLGGSRPFTVPVQLGWRSKPFTQTEFNQDPHPFI